MLKPGLCVMKKLGHLEPGIDHSVKTMRYKLLLKSLPFLLLWQSNVTAQWRTHLGVRLSLQATHASLGLRQVFP